METLTKLSTSNLIIIGLVLIIVVYIIVKSVKKFKFGKLEFDNTNGHTNSSINDKPQSIDLNSQMSSLPKDKFNRILTVEVMNFTWRLSQEQKDAESYYKKTARRLIKQHIYDYEALLKGKYLTVLKENYPDDYKLIFYCFSSELSGQYYMNQMQIFMDLYEHNHITDLSDDELRTKAKEVYIQMTSLFQEHFRDSNVNDIVDYSVLHNVCNEIKGDVINRTYTTIKDIQSVLKRLYKARESLQEVRNCTSTWIIEKGLLPIHADALVSGFFEEDKGINMNTINQYLDMIKITK